MLFPGCYSSAPKLASKFLPFARSSDPSPVQRPPCDTRLSTLSKAPDPKLSCEALPPARAVQVPPPVPRVRPPASLSRKTSRQLPARQTLSLPLRNSQSFRNATPVRKCPHPEEGLISLHHRPRP